MFGPLNLWLPSLCCGTMDATKHLPGSMPSSRSGVGLVEEAWSKQVVQSDKCSHTVNQGFILETLWVVMTNFQL